MAVETTFDDELRPEYDLTALKDGIRGKYHRAFRAGRTTRIGQADDSIIVRQYKFEVDKEVLASEARIFRRPRLMRLIKQAK